MISTEKILRDASIYSERNNFCSKSFFYKKKKLQGSDTFVKKNLASNLIMISNIIFIILTLFSIYSGIKFGWTDSHTPPPQFVISVLLFFLGLLLILFKKILFAKTINFHIHTILIVVNLLVVVLCLFPILK